MSPPKLFIPLLIFGLCGAAPTPTPTQISKSHALASYALLDPSLVDDPRNGSLPSNVDANSRKAASPHRKRMIVTSHITIFEVTDRPAEESTTGDAEPEAIATNRHVQSRASSNAAVPRMRRQMKGAYWKQTGIHPPQEPAPVPPSSSFISSTSSSSPVTDADSDLVLLTSFSFMLDAISPSSTSGVGSSTSVISLSSSSSSSSRWVTTSLPPTSNHGLSTTSTSPQSVTVSSSGNAGTQAPANGAEASPSPSTDPNPNSGPNNQPLPSGLPPLATAPLPLGDTGNDGNTETPESNPQPQGSNDVPSTGHITRPLAPVNGYMKTPFDARTQRGVNMVCYTGWTMNVLMLVVGLWQFLRYLQPVEKERRWGRKVGWGMVRVWEGAGWDGWKEFDGAGR